MAKKDRKPRLVILRGLPASGKSTYAEELVILEERTARVNKDKIREMAACMTKSDKKRRDWSWERQFQEIEFQAARIFLRDGFNVVVDDTNLKDSMIEKWKELARDEHADFEVKSFLDVPIEECIKRDAQRPEPVGKAVIYGLAASAGLIESANEKVELSKPYIVVDLDGTLCDCEHRVHLVKGNQPDWNAFFEAMVYDTPREHVVDMVRTTYEGYPVVIVTGRPEPYRILCSQWLDYYDIKYHSLLMRRPNDRRPDTEVKQEILDKYLDKSKIKAWIDDRPSVIRQIASNGIPIVGVGTGEDF